MEIFKKRKKEKKREVLFLCDDARGYKYKEIRKQLGYSKGEAEKDIEKFVEVDGKYQDEIVPKCEECNKKMSRGKLKIIGSSNHCRQEELPYEQLGNTLKNAIEKGEKIIR